MRLTRWAALAAAALLCACTTLGSRVQTPALAPARYGAAANLYQASQEIVSSTGAIVARADLHAHYGMAYGATAGGSEVGSFSNAAPLSGAERILADQNGNTVNLTPAQIGQYLGIPNGILFPLPISFGGTGANTAAGALQNLLPTFVANGCLSNNGSNTLWVGCGVTPAGGNYQLQYNLSSALAAVPTGTANYPLLSGGSSAAPAFGQLDLTLAVKNALPVANGGTGLSSITLYALVAGGGTSSPTLIAPSTTPGEALVSNGPSSYPSFSTSLPGITSINGTNIPAAAGTAVGSTGTFTVGHCTQVASVSPLEIQDSGSPGCGGGGGGAVSSVAAGPSGSVSVSPTTGAVQVDLAAQVAATILANLSGTTAAPTANSMPAVQAAMVAANAKSYAPTLAAGATTDWDPSGGAGITTTGFASVTPNAAGSTLDGVVAGSDKQQFLLCNAATLGSNGQYIVLENQSASEPTAANRLLMAGNLALGPQMCAMFRYIGGSIIRWLVSAVANGGVQATEPLASGSSMTPDQSFRYVTVTASTPGPFTVNAPTDGTPQDFQTLLFRIQAAAALSAPTQSTPTTSGSAGSCGASTAYYYVVTATDAMGETTKSNEQSIATGSGGSNENTLTWATVTGASGYKVYRGTSSGGENTAYTISSGSTLAFTDTCASGTGASPPVSNTSGGNTYAWNSIYHPSSTVPLPSGEPTAGAKDLIAFIYNAIAGSWYFAAPNQGY